MNQSVRKNHIFEYTLKIYQKKLNLRFRDARWIENSATLQSLGLSESRWNDVIDTKQETLPKQRWPSSRIEWVGIASTGGGVELNEKDDREREKAEEKIGRLEW